MHTGDARQHFGPSRIPREPLDRRHHGGCLGPIRVGTQHQPDAALKALEVVAPNAALLFEGFANGAYHTPTLGRPMR